MRHANYSFMACTVQIEGNTADLQWLDEFLLPWFTPAPHSSPSHRIALLADAERYARLALTPAQGDLIGFVKDGPPAQLSRHVEDDGAIWFFQRELSIFYQVTGALIQVLGNPASPRNRFCMAQAARELFMEQAFANGNPILHAAAVAHDGKAALILGDKRAGKTTLSMNCVTRLGFNFIANDRVAILPNDQHLSVHGIPTLVRIRNTSRSLLPELPWKKIDRLYNSRETLEAALQKNAVPSSYGSADELEATFLSPAQHCWLMDTNPLSHATLSAVLLPIVDESTSGMTLESLPAPEYAAALRAANFAGNIDANTTRLFEQGDAQSCNKWLLQMQRELPAYRCRLGKGALEDRDTLRQLIEAN